MIFNSCMPIDIAIPPNEGENFSPTIISATLDPFYGPYNFSELSDDDSLTITVKITDLNDNNDILTLGWYVKDVNNQLEVPYKYHIEKKATDNETNTNARFTFELKKDYLVCGLNRVILLVSDRGLKPNGISGDGTPPYPSNTELINDEENAKKVKIDLREWLIRKECI